MQKDRADLAHAAIGEAMTGGRALCPRDEVLLWALEVGLTRRADDAHGLVRAWQIARVQRAARARRPVQSPAAGGTHRCSHADARRRPAGEPVGRRLEAPRRTRGSAAVVDSAALGRGASRHPCRETRRAGSRTRAALVRASGQSHLAVVLATAGRTWLTVLAGNFQVAAVEAAARGLASVGMTWDGSRLAGHAAPRAEERKDMARLLACARNFARGLPAPTSHSDTEARIVGTPRGRERASRR